MVRIEVLATDGNAIRRILWIDKSQGGLQAGFFVKGSDVHLTYHSDGTKWRTVGQAPAEEIGMGPPLNNFKNMIQIGDFAFRTKMSEITNIAPVYSMGRIDFIQYVDVRSWQSSAIGCNLFLLEPSRYDLLRSLIEPPTGTDLYAPSQVCLFTRVNPWLLIILREIP